MKRICTVCTPGPVTAKDLLHKLQNQFIPSDVKALDQCLRGGFRIGTITEIVGRAGVGKTQLVMQICVVAARLGYGSIFIDTEKKLSLQRLHEIARERSKLNFSVEDSVRNDGNNNSTKDQEVCDYSRPAEVMKNIIVHSPTSTDELLSVVSQLDEEIIIRSEPPSSFEDSSDAKLPIKVIILDSIAAPTRRDFGGGSAPQRVASIFQLAQTLKRVADQMQVAVIVINQIDKVHSAPGDQPSEGDFSSVSAALGTSWHHCVSTRIALEHYHDPHNTSALEGDRVRTASVVKSNLVGQSRIMFEVTMMGICQVNC
jgi:RecA/RadA recombinase